MTSPSVAKYDLRLAYIASLLIASVMILGSVLGVVALAVIGAGLFGWDGVLRPVAALAPSGTLVAAFSRGLTP